MRVPPTFTAVLVSGLSLIVDSFVVVPRPVQSQAAAALIAVDGKSPLFASRYGPPSDGPPSNSNADEEQEEWERLDDARVARQEVEFRELLEKVMTTTNPQHLPSLMTRHMDMLLTIRGYEGTSLIKNIINEARDEGGEQGAQQVMEGIDFILDFVEEFVGQAQSIDDNNKKLLGKIIRAMTNKGEDTSSTAASSSVDRELLLDELMERERDNFSAGFLRHLEGECERIASAPIMTPDSSRLLETLRVIHARVLEELGKELGEGALVLGQLLGYDDKNERLAVLDAGLTVRGVGFAEELVKLTEEALDGFQRVPGGADPGLVERVTDIDKRIRIFIEKNNVMQ